MLLACDSFSSGASGGLVARRIASALGAWGARVRVFSVRDARQSDESIPGVEAITVETPLGLEAPLQHLMQGRIARTFRAELETFQPQVVHFASFEYAKPRFMIRDAKASGARVVLQPWIHSFFCHQAHDYRNGGPCGACAGGRFERAIMKGCVSPGRGAVHFVQRRLLRADALHADCVYSTNRDLDERLIRYGFDAGRIVRGPLPFDPDRLQRLNASDGSEFVFHGQAKHMKGFHLLRAIIDRCPSTDFALLPLGCSQADRVAAGLDSPGPRVIFDATMRWSTGLADRLARARAVLLPSLWPSTTEYALLEALGWGKPVVAFAVGVNTEILMHRKNAMVVPVGDIEAYSSAVRELDRDPELRKQIGLEARHTFERLTSEAELRSPLMRAYALAGSSGT